MNLQDKVIVITGASHGFGYALAKAFKETGSRVVISARKSEELNQAARMIGVTFCEADVTSEPEVLNLARKVIDQLGRIDIWINNAGIWMPPAFIEQVNWQHAHQLIEVNLFGTIYGSKAALLQMRKQGNGWIINILSTTALDGRAKSSAYGASKFAALGFTKALRKELEGSGVKAMAVFPGGMQTHLFDAQKPDDIGEYMNPEEVAKKVIANLSLENPEEDFVIKRPAKP